MSHFKNGMPTRGELLYERFFNPYTTRHELFLFVVRSSQDESLEIGQKANRDAVTDVGDDNLLPIFQHAREMHD